MNSDFAKRALRATVALLVLAATLHPVSLFAHAQLIRSNPQARAELAKTPALLELWFNELLEDSFNSIALFPSKDARAKTRPNLVEGKPSVDPKDRAHLTIKLKRLDPGEYTVEFRVLSRDGHSAPGRFTFRVIAPLAVQP